MRRPVPPPHLNLGAKQSCWPHLQEAPAGPLHEAFPPNLAAEKRRRFGATEGRRLGSWGKRCCRLGWKPLAGASHGHALRAAQPLAIAAALLATTLAGCTQISVSAEGLDLPHGQMAEVNLLMHQGDAVSIAWSATAPIHFNVHTHQGTKVVELVTQDGPSYTGTFSAPAAGAYSLFWQNQGANGLQLTYSVKGAGAVDSVQPRLS